MKKNKIIPLIMVLVILLTCAFQTTLCSAYTIDTVIYNKWLSMNGSSGVMGNLTSDTIVSGSTRYVNFTNGIIIRSSTSDTCYAIYGKIYEKYKPGQGWFGLPTGDTFKTFYWDGLAQTFQNGNCTLFYKNGYTGACAVYGQIRAFYGTAGYETSALGYPITDEYYTKINNFEKNVSHFEKGAIYYNSAFGAWPMMYSNVGSYVSKLNAVQPKLEVKITPNQLGISAQIIGSGFEANKSVDVYLSRMTRLPYGIARATTSSTGSFTITRSGSNYISDMDIETLKGNITFFAKEVNSPITAIYSGYYSASPMANFPNTNRQID